MNPDTCGISATHPFSAVSNFVGRVCSFLDLVLKKALEYRIVALRSAGSSTLRAG
jgi:hypothetical protein